ncbi:MAG: bifunctional methylenetetrahydrofolate dehydrogenase/methenyltetrahydrofolate cyclohydrolase, partial [Lachnospiraceae bacterium]|nr:bifunctional methylenetetrahydrofolate dehydrogenase/methenyltetrahydrofolate cyclohydrolase [Lachnospiraceae bacterium]
MPMIIDGKRISQELKDELKDKVAGLKTEGIEISLAVVLVGDDPASQVYVRNKKKACEYVGIRSLSYELPETTTQEELLELVDTLNNKKDCNGILVQLPLPSHIDEDAVIAAIHPNKDVDGFHPSNVGRLWIGQPGFLSCTPAGVIELLKRSKIPMDGKRAVVVGRSNIVGKPMAALLLRENATVTVAHSHTENLPGLCQQADILVAA